jgi:hypothetical protein
MLPRDVPSIVVLFRERRARRLQRLPHDRCPDRAVRDGLE